MSKMASLGLLGSVENRASSHLYDPPVILYR